MPNSEQILLFPHTAPAIGRRESMTFKANRNLGRHGWLRLTPAYSRHLVEALVGAIGPSDRVLDPFCGTGTTALTCAEKNIRCDTVDINPFLVWLARAKLAFYSPSHIDEARDFGNHLRQPASDRQLWRPPLKDIEKWWDPRDLEALAGLCAVIKEAKITDAARNLLFSAFCRVAIETARVSFNHQSMSFKAASAQWTLANMGTPSNLQRLFARRLGEILEAAAIPLGSNPPTAILGDSRELDKVVSTTYTLFGLWRYFFRELHFSSHLRE
jgi:hypothetical protein